VKRIMISLRQSSLGVAIHKLSDVALWWNSRLVPKKNDLRSLHLSSFCLEAGLFHYIELQRTSSESVINELATGNSDFEEKHALGQ
jgi:hypothetical protein